MKNYYSFLLCLIISCALHGETFKVATWNILAQKPYEKWAFEESTTKPTLWEQKKRIPEVARLITHLIDNEHVDVICLQELNLEDKDDWDPVFKVFHNNNYVLRDFPPSKMPEKGRVTQTTCIAYNPKKFSAKNSEPHEWYEPIGGKGLTSVILDLNDYVDAPKINVMSLHLAFASKDKEPLDPTDTKNMAKYKSFQQMKILEQILNNETIRPIGTITIICGDFNWPTNVYFYNYQVSLSKNDARLSLHLNPAYAALMETIAKSTHSIWSDAAKSNKKNHSDPTSNQGWGTLETIDYILYTNPTSYEFKHINFKQLPKFNYQDANKYFDALIKHGYPIPHEDLHTLAKNNKDKTRIELLQQAAKNALTQKPPKDFKEFGTFPSDHAILIAEFELDTSTMKKRKGHPSAYLDDFGAALTSVSIAK